MIFISHNSKDKPLITPIADELAKIFGRENVFYDSWSIQPGDSLIGEMNNGLEKCKFFFLFV
ncbi:MAG TPA: toll/interleukin-1 receptor domain-containing protein, partial [Chitinophagaceae bacterium]|nr:toll/interleukin-1 receptor domain-containing protein [Chitinophagaceae bacterium]